MIPKRKPLSARDIKIEHYKQQIEKMKNPRTYTERVMLQVYQDMVRRYENPKG